MLAQLCPDKPILSADVFDSFRGAQLWQVTLGTVAPLSPEVDGAGLVLSDRLVDGTNLVLTTLATPLCDHGTSRITIGGLPVVRLCCLVLQQLLHRFQLRSQLLQSLVHLNVDLIRGCLNLLGYQLDL
jgi:hypothetical protein